MSHISGKLEWNEAVFLEAKTTRNQLVVYLADGTTRAMNVMNWETSNKITADKAKAIKSGARVKLATWNGFDANKWFCDIEPA